MSDLTLEDYARLAEFRYLLRKFHAFSEERAREGGLSPQQHQALLAIVGRRSQAPMTVGDLAEQLQIQHHSAVGLVDRLVAIGLAAREKDAVDHRRVHVALTAEGGEVIQELSAAHRDEIERLAPELVAVLASLTRTT